MTRGLAARQRENGLGSIVDVVQRREPASGRRLALVDTLPLAALSLCAAAIHFALVPAHADEWLGLAVAFAVTGWAQAGLACALLIRPSRALVLAGVGLQVAVLGAWAVSRTVGLPFGPDAGVTEAVDLVDLWAAALEAAFVFVAAMTLGAPARPRAAWTPLGIGTTTGALLLAGGLTTAAIASPSAVDHHGGDDAAHAHDGDASAQPPTREQLARAADLLVRTTAAIHPRYDDTEAARAAGFIPIQGEEADFVHWVNLAWMRNPTILDPDEPESLVYRSTPQGQVLEAAMYILPEVGMPDPDVGGSLTVWHNHGDLCFRAGDAQIVGTTERGPCPAGSLNVPTADMLHVWTVDRPGGPFEGIEMVGR